MTFKEIIDQGYEIEITKLSNHDYSDDPELFDLEAYRVAITSPEGEVFLFNFEYDAPFEEALSEAFEYISLTKN